MLTAAIRPQGPIGAVEDTEVPESWFGGATAPHG